MSSNSKVYLFDIPVNALTIKQFVLKIEDLLEGIHPHQIVTVNPEILLAIELDPLLKEIIKEASLVTADGEGVVWAASFLSSPVPERVTGIDLMERLLQEAAVKGWKAVFLGGKPGISKKAAEVLMNKYSGLIVAETFDGYFSSEYEKRIISQIMDIKPKLLFVGLGAPRQEKWIRSNLNKFQFPMVAMGVGGSFDVFSGKVSRAPVWVRNMRIEWLYRLIKEPSRIARQIKLPIFIWKTIMRKYS